MTDPNFRIETDRLYISYCLPTSPTHCAFLVQLYNSPSFIATCGNTGITTTEQAKAFIEKRFVATHARHGHGQYLVSLKETSKHVGIVSLMKGDSPEQSYPVPDVGFAMLPEVSGQGYATEAARKLLDYASEVLGVKEVFGFTDAKNTASRRVLEKLGLEDRGVHLLRVFNFEASSVYTSPSMVDLKAYGIE
ncbi:GNAT family acetyltransferase [Desarmillaria tabescens]|uniref:GNAT family acetyltransferase n=1 Tax=Armillaria tabescens TaxID=1929756 RepID=A0AA39N729_ARMTA|nr:GNAT family acetyltransferase [Desarmillaria tabescens]KAK0459859.1 GNAT family acetyltransferase [Desarmillaria tabescens]